MLNPLLETIILYNIFFCVRQKKETHEGLEPLEVEHFYFILIPFVENLLKLDFLLKTYSNNFI